MKLEPDEERARAVLAHYSSAGHYWGAWLVAFVLPTILALYAYSRDETVGMLIAFALMLAISVWQGCAGIRSNRALSRLLQRYESALAEQQASSNGGSQAH